MFGWSSSDPRCLWSDPQEMPMFRKDWTFRESASYNNRILPHIRACVLSPRFFFALFAQIVYILRLIEQSIKHRRLGLGQMEIEDDTGELADTLGLSIGSGCIGRRPGEKRYVFRASVCTARGDDRNPPGLRPGHPGEIKKQSTLYMIINVIGGVK